MISELHYLEEVRASEDSPIGIMSIKELSTDKDACGEWHHLMCFIKIYIFIRHLTAITKAE